MIIDAKEEAVTLWRAKTFIIAVYLVLLTVSFVFLANFTVRMIIICSSSFIILLLGWLHNKMDYYYFYFSDNGNNLVFRFYSMRGIFYGKPKTIEMQKSSFVKYDILTSFFNAKESLELYQKTAKGIAKYPSISLTILNKKQKTELKRALFSMVN